MKRRQQPIFLPFGTRIAKGAMAGLALGVAFAILGSAAVIVLSIKSLSIGLIWALDVAGYAFMGALAGAFAAHLTSYWKAMAVFTAACIPLSATLIPILSDIPLFSWGGAATCLVASAGAAYVGAVDFRRCFVELMRQK